MKNSQEKNIFIFGDSCTQGFWDSQGGWATRLKQYFDNSMVSAPNFPQHEFYHMVYPLGVTDDTTKNILERFEFETEKRMAWGTTEEIFIFAIGKNDTAISDINEYERNIRDIIKRAKRFSNKIAFLETGAVNEKLTQPVVWNDRYFYTNEKIKAYNYILNKIAQEEEVDIIPLFDDWIKEDYTKLLADGVHPNDDGHKYIFEKVKNFLLENYI